MVDKQGVQAPNAGPVWSVCLSQARSRAASLPARPHA